MLHTIPHIQQQQGDIHILILGGGKGGLALLGLFHQYRHWLWIAGMVDINAHAVAMQSARKAGIPTYTDIQQAIDDFTGDIIIDVTGNPSMRDILSRIRQTHSHLEVISGKSSRLLFDLVHQEQKQQETIKYKDIHLKLLNTMLDISLRFEEHHNASAIIRHATQSLHEGLEAQESLAIIVDERNHECFAPQMPDTP